MAFFMAQGDPVLDHATPLSWALKHCTSAIAQGLPADELLQDCFVDSGEKPSEGRIITSSQFALLCVNLILKLDDESQGIARKPMPVGSVAMGVRVMLGAATLGEGLQSFFRFYQMVCPFYHWKLDVNGDIATIALSIEGRDRISAHSGEEIHTAAIHMYMSWFAGKAIPLIESLTPCADNPGLDGVSRLFLKCPTRMADYTAIRFPKACLNWRRRAQDYQKPVTMSVRFAMDNIWLPDSRGSSVEEVLQQGGFAEAVRQTFENMETPSLENIAASLNMTPITLWRHLKSEGTNYRKVRQAWLVEKAIDKLRHTGIDTESLAEELGFSDARSLRHSLKSSTGLTPSAIRASAAEFDRLDAQRDRVKQRTIELCGRLDQ